MLNTQITSIFNCAWGVRFIDHPINKVETAKQNLSFYRCKIMPKKKDIGKEFGFRLTELMKSRNLSIREASKLSGVAPSVIQSWKSGSSPHEFDRLKTLAEKGLGVSLSFLLTGQQDQGRIPSIEEVFQEGEILYDGIAKISIQALVPKKKNRG